MANQYDGNNYFHKTILGRKYYQELTLQQQQRINM